MDYEQRRNRNGGGGGGGGYRRHSRSRSRTRSRSRERSRDNYRQRSRERTYRGGGGGNNEKDLYRDIINDDYQDDNKGFQRNRNDEHNDERDRYWNDRQRDKGRDYDRDYDRKERYGSRHRYNSSERDSDNSDEPYQYNYNKTPSNTIIVLRLKKHITEADIMSALIQQNAAPTIVRLIRKRETGASRGFAFVEFNTVDEAAHWMDLNQGTIMLGDVRAELQYSYSREHPTDWYCLKCGVYNFRRRDKCFRCYASREESSNGAEGGHDEVSNILTKKVMLRNLDTLTNEEGVLTAIQQHVPDLVKKITKILISRDTLTQTSRGICYLNFETLVDSMNLHNALVGLEPPLKIDNREVRITYCVDHENRQIVPKKSAGNSDGSAGGATGNTSADLAGMASGQYTLADVPRLAEYSASLYASTPEEHAHYLQYYTDYYVSEINKGQYTNLPTATQMTEANSGAAVALSAIQRKQKKMNSIETTATHAAAAAAQAAAAVKAALAAQTAQTIVTPKGNDGKVYPVPDVTLYQYDETSGYYYDPTTGLYYDAHSQYYYNNETGAYLYWDQRKSTYVLATPAAAAATVEDVVKQETEAATASASVNTEEESKKEKKESGNKQDKVKVAKKIVKDMEKWAKQLNQKKDYTAVATPQPILANKSDAIDAATSRGNYGSGAGGSYADIGFSILEKKERSKLSDYVAPAAAAAAYGGSDSDDEQVARMTAAQAALTAKSNAQAAAAAASAQTSNANAASDERDYVDFQKLTCLLCKRAFQSLDILHKHLKMSNLHKENLQKYKLNRSQAETSAEAAAAAQNALNYRDRAKERRLKYGECDPPPPNRTRERFENEIKSLTSRASAELPALPIASNNVGSRLLQKMGWSEGQGLGRKNQGRTNIIEADSRNSTAGLGTKAGMGPNDDYKTYIKKMMKSRYESV